MSLLNYTTSIKAAKTANEVQAILVKGGARQIMSVFDDDGQVSALSFSVMTQLGMRGFTLPVDWLPVLSILNKDPRVPGHKKNNEHARNVAWRIMKDWIEAQMALVETGMVTFDQVMLPYMRSVEGATFYDEYLAGHGSQPALGAG